MRRSLALWQIQWGSEYWASLAFKRSKVVRSPNGLVLECYLNTGLNLVQYSDNHLNNRTEFEWWSEYPTTI